METYLRNIWSGTCPLQISRRVEPSKSESTAFFEEDELRNACGGLNLDLEHMGPLVLMNFGN